MKNTITKTLSKIRVLSFFLISLLLMIPTITTFAQSSTPTEGTSGTGTEQPPTDGTSGTGTGKTPTDGSSGTGTGKTPTDGTSGTGTGKTPTDGTSGTGTGKTPTDGTSGTDTGKTPTDGTSGTGTGKTPTDGTSGTGTGKTPTDGTSGTGSGTNTEKTPTDGGSETGTEQPSTDGTNETGTEQPSTDGTNETGTEQPSTDGSTETGTEQPSTDGSTETGTEQPSTDGTSGTGTEPSQSLTEILEDGVSDQITKIPPESFTTLNKEQVVEIPSKAFSSFTEKQIAAISPTAISGMTAEQMVQTQKNTLSGITTAQFEKISLETLSGLTSENMGGLSINVVREFTSEKISVLDVEQFKKMSSIDISKFFTNFDSEKMSISDIEHLVPDNWTLDLETGALTAPVDTKIILQIFSIDLSSEVRLPLLPNLNVGFGVSGGGTSVLEDMEQSFIAANLQYLSPSQNDQGVFEVKNTQNEKITYNFIPDVGNIVQVDQEKNPSDIKLDDGGFYQAITSDGLQVQFASTPKDSEELSEILDNGKVSVGSQGDVFMELPEQTQNGFTQIVGIFNPATEDVSESSENIQAGFNWIKEPGTGIGQKAQITYEDGTTQSLYPTFPQPDIFIETALEIDGVEEVTFKANGTFAVIFKGEHYLIMPNFGTKSRKLAEDESSEANIVIENGTLTYTVLANDSQEETQNTRRTRDSSDAREAEVYETDSEVEYTEDDYCVETDDGEVVCDYDYY
jgi:hypothetical protein